MAIDLHKIPSIPDILEEVAGVICDGYCKFPEIYKDRPEQELWDECCADCPLRVLS